MEHQPLTLANIANGAACELFEQEMARVLENILDPNTDPKAKREIKLTIKILPTEDRDVGHVAVESQSKIAGYLAVGTAIYMGRGTDGKPVASEQPPLDFEVSA